MSKQKKTSTRSRRARRGPVANARRAGPPWLLFCLIFVALGAWFTLGGDIEEDPNESSGGPAEVAVASGSGGNELRRENIPGTSEPTAPQVTAAIDDKQLGRLQMPSRSSSLDDPSQDGWPTELFSQQAQAVLDQLGKLVQSPTKIDAAACQTLVARGFTCSALLPPSWNKVYETADVVVERAAVGASADFEGSAGLAAALQQLTSQLDPEAEIRIKFKMIRVELESNTATTEQLVSLFGATPAGLVEHHCTWKTEWQLAAVGQAPRLLSLVATDHRQAKRPRGADKLFADCTESALRGNSSYRTQLLHGYDHWLGSTQENQYFFYFGNPGLAVGDVNGDGRDDLYLCQEDGLPNLLLLAQPEGTFQDAASAWGVDWLHNSRSALLVDWDNDGDQDLAVGITGGVILAENIENSRFEFRSVLPTDDDVMSISAADFDRDALLDLYVCVYTPTADVGQPNAGGVVIDRTAFVYHDANNGAANRLFRNLGDWQFEDVTAEVGLDENNRRWSFAASWEDYDNDGDLDLYVANDFGRDNLFQNRGGRFADVAAAAGAEDSASGMGISWGDFDRDGWMDVHVSNMFSAAGNRITSQQQFMPSVSAEVRQRHQRLGRGNTLLRNRGDGTFENVSAPAGIEMGRWAWGSNLVDINNDGWEDVLVANGHVTTENSGDL